MQALKALVIFMGVLILAGMGLLVYGLMTRIGNGPADTVTATAKPFGELEYNLSADANISGISVDSGRAIVDIRHSDGSAELRVFDLSTGKPSGTIKLRAAP